MIETASHFRKPALDGWISLTQIPKSEAIHTSPASLLAILSSKRENFWHKMFRIIAVSCVGRGYFLKPIMGIDPSSAIGSTKADFAVWIRKTDRCFSQSRIQLYWPSWVSLRVDPDTFLNIRDTQKVPCWPGDDAPLSWKTTESGLPAKQPLVPARG